MSEQIGRFFAIFIICLISTTGRSQIGNYVSNGSFESLNTNSVSSYYGVVNYWQAIDTTKSADYLGTMLPPIANAPYAYGFQYPRTGKNYIGSSFYCTTFPNAIGYPKNRLKKPLQANVTYCVKLYVVNTNNSPLATDGYGIYFADSSIDTINYCNVPLTYLTPQIQNPSGNIITDTLNWTAITGTFVANGTEKYMVLGNFKSEAATNTLLINPTYSMVMTHDVCIDDVSCIELNLPAYAGPDKSFIPGDSAFIGREPDFAIDPGCMWYKLPNTTTAIDTISGLWVKPTVTTTYVVRQELDCSPVKWDTVVVFINGVGIEKLRMINEELRIYPVPAINYIELRAGNNELVRDFTQIEIYNNLGQLIREEDISFNDSPVSIKTDELPNGVYSLQLKNSNNENINKKFLVSH